MLAANVAGVLAAESPFFVTVFQRPIALSTVVVVVPLLNQTRRLDPFRPITVHLTFWVVASLV